MIIEKTPTGLNIISSDVGPPEASAANERSGKILIERNVNKKMLSLLNKFMIPLFFIALETTNIYFL